MPDGTPQSLDATSLPRHRATYHSRACDAAFGTGEVPVDPAHDFAANERAMSQIYDYYGSLHRRRPELLWWAGLARVAGASVMRGLDVATTHGVDGDWCRMFIDVARRIFTDLAWLHEAFLDDPELVVELAGWHDREQPASQSYRRCWENITSGGQPRIAEGNRGLLANEQLDIVQPCYERFRPEVRAMSPAIRGTHPYHPDFGALLPDGDVGDADQRWQWIDGPGGMWQSWIELSEAERARLVDLPLDALRAREFGTSD